MQRMLSVVVLCWMIAAMRSMAQDVGTWEPVASMSMVHFRHAAILLKNGKVLVAGGYYGTPELYDPATNSWSTLAASRLPRSRPSVTMLQDGRVLVAGGSSDTSAEIFDPETNTWSDTGSMNVMRTGHTGTLLPDGKVLIVGSDNWADGASSELYDPDSNSWTPGPNFEIPRANHTATLMANGKVLVVGSDNITNYEAYEYSKRVELYDSATNTISRAADTSVGRNAHSACLLPDGDVLIICGNRADTCERYHPATDTWSITARIAAARYAPSVTVLRGKVVVAGGYNGFAMASVELFDPDLNTWTPGNNLNTARLNHTATLLPNGDVLIAGGQDLDGYLSSAERFKTWPNRAPSIDSPIVVQSNPVLTGIPAVLVVAASDPDNDRLYYAWDFGDGSTGAGNPASHTYLASGTYTVKVIVRDGNGEAVVASTVISSVNTIHEIDTDGDGFSDALEIASGSDPFKADSTPFAAPPVQFHLPLPVSKVSIRLNFQKPGNDSIQLSANLLLDDTIDLNTQKIIVDVGGVARSFTLNPTGSAQSDTDLIQMKSSGAGARLAQLNLRLSKGNFAAALAPAGLTNSNAVKGIVLPVTVLLGGVIYQHDVALTYVSKLNKFGTTKKSR